MKRETFENYLQGVHGENYGGLDDDMPEAFESWYEDLGIETLARYFDEFALKQYNLGFSDNLKKLDEVQLDLQEAKEANINH